jgi:hypothetical protein
MKLLVVTEFPPNASGGGPAVVRQMLKDWPAADLGWWACLPELNQRFGQQVHEVRCASIPARFYPNQKLTGIKSFLLEHFWSPWATVHLRKTLREVAPDVIWAIPHNWSISPIANALTGARRRTHVTIQDYVDVHDNPRRFGAKRCRRLAARADDLYAKAATRDATSHPMIADLQARTGRSAAQMLHAGLEAADFEFLASKSPGASPAIRIAYAGTILVEDVFKLFVSAMERIRGGLAKSVELHLFGAHPYAKRSWFDPGWMVEHGNLPEPELLARLRKCDWGFAPMGLTDEEPRYNRFSFPTKFISYLAAGLAVMTLGHAESSVMKMATQYDVGLCTNERDATALAARLESVLRAPSPWQRYREAILHCARTEFDAARMRRVLYGCFSTCAEMSARAR